MLWRSSYKTLILQNVPLPFTLDSKIKVLIVLLSPTALPEAELWRRLIAADLAKLSFGIVLSGSSTETLQSLLPPSLHTHVLDLPLVDWLELAKPSSADRALALVVSGSEAAVLMVGPPTEDAWDEFVAAIDT